MVQASPLDDPWFVQAFDRTWLRLYAHRDDAEATAAAPAMVGHLGLDVGGRILDVGCGGGRYARALADYGMRVTGVDLSEELLEVAREKSPYLPGKPDFYRRDIRKLPFFGQFDGAVSMFTSFGYFDRREDDLAIFRGVHRGLISGGRFLVDFLNAEQVRATLVESEQRDDGKMIVDIERRIADGPFGPCVFKRIRAADAISGRSLAEFEERVRLYTPDEVEALLSESGFALLGDRMGDVQGAPHDASAGRFVRLAERS
ncbi:MAG: class I SAM-dependent methyltransferase [Planctomycetota bacterium]|nr:class I SAM-dependent methyltransferase [Planctomycetota bacterium]